VTELVVVLAVVVAGCYSRVPVVAGQACSRAGKKQEAAVGI
jgi:hypothetical protein